MGNFDRIDVIYNNAGVYLPGKDGRITDIDEAVREKVLAINQRSVFLFCKYGIPLMMEHGGSTVNTAFFAAALNIRSSRRRRPASRDRGRKAVRRCREPRRDRQPSSEASGCRAAPRT